MAYTGHKRSDGVIQPLLDHLTGVAELASAFSRTFSADDHARRTGLLHDIGKYAPDVQRRMNDPEHERKVNHTSAGAQEAFRLRDVAGMFAIAAHHGGLMDRVDLLGGKLRYTPQDYSAFRQEIAPDPNASAPAWAQADPQSMCFYTRMLFSCLVDADYLDTESFMRGKPVRTSLGEPLPVLLERLLRRVEGWYPPRTPLNARRCAILDSCAGAAGGEQGLYTLTVPTGGGKTIASLLFALKHAVHHGLSRVIYVIPYTSIIEQNAAVFADILGHDNVLEHHSSLREEEPGEDEELNAANARKRLACENWDAPVVVTTAVQFFESLFAAGSGKCRKLHSIASSVIIFDEAQMLPLNFLRPCVYAIAELVKHYRATAVLCTATQPALNQLLEEYLPGQPVREIVPDRDALYHVLRRTVYRHEGEMSQDALVSGLMGSPQSLCIVNSRKLARELYDVLPDEGRYHLSTWMTPADRRRVIADIRSRLAASLPCHVISTSLIEAGVDLDFPTVWREEAGLDAIVQAGGRCNREGRRRPEDSVVHVFRLTGHHAVGFRQQIDAFRQATEDGSPMDAPETIQRYFDALLASKGAAIDKEDIMQACEEFRFRTVAGRFRLIDSQDTVTVYIPTEHNADDLYALCAGCYSRQTLRRLQQDSVTVYQADALKLYSAGCLKNAGDGFWILTDPARYDHERGLLLHSEDGLGFLV